MKQYDIGIDLGTTSIIIATEEQGVVFRQPTIGAVDTRTNSIIAVGDAALKMVGRAPAHIDLVRPLRDGIIQDHRMTNELIVRFVNEVCRSRFFKPQLGVPQLQILIDIFNKNKITLAFYAHANSSILWIKYSSLI